MTALRILSEIAILIAAACLVCQFICIFTELTAAGIRRARTAWDRFVERRLDDLCK